ncbi:MAG: O-antigen ligase family protein [Acidimicrobiales bacterium]
MTSTISRRPATRLDTVDVAPRWRPRPALPQPGLTEQALVVITTFILLHGTPNIWFRSRADFLLDSSNPILVIVELGLIGMAFLRVAGSIDHLIAMARSEPLVYLYAGITFASIFWSADPGETIKRSIGFLALTAYGSYLVMRFPLERTLRLLALMFGIGAVLNLAFVFGFPDYGVDADGQWTGVFSQKNGLGFAAALAVPAMIVAGRESTFLRPFFYLGAVAHLVLLVGSDSKTMLVGTVGPVALSVVYRGFRGRSTLRGAVIISLAGMSVFTLAFATANIALLAKWLDKDVSLTGRVPLWETLMPIALDRPFTGYGYGATFGGFFSPVHEVWIQNQWKPSHAHNALLQTTLEIGLIGVVLFLVLYFRVISGAIKLVVIVPRAIGLWPLVFLTTTLLVSITESGIAASGLGWVMFVVAAVTVPLHLRHRTELGYSNDFRTATHAYTAYRRLGVPRLRGRS